MDVSVTGLFFPVLLLNQEWSPPLTLQASHCSTFRIMCDVPSIAVFCSESIEYFPGTVSKFFFKLLVTIPVAPIITGTIVHFWFLIRYISTHKLLYFNFFSASFCTTFLSAGIATSISYYYYYYYYYYVKCQLFLSGLNESWIFLLDRVSKKNIQISNFMKVRPLGAQLNHPDGQADGGTHRHDAEESRFSQLCRS